ncbi:MAG TPA: hypothetical protein EYQ50_01775 [Verrucomicrobiales bacterium]|nr:hypothetical protein [Verrucomicrobiales bacterium]HIL68421.1 hypothetical protein [Verrucomicrobiota bacterium]
MRTLKNIIRVRGGLLFSAAISMAWLQASVQAEDEKLKTSKSSLNFIFPDERAIGTSPGIFESLNPKSSSSGVVIHHSIIGPSARSSSAKRNSKDLMRDMLSKSGLNLSKEDINNLSSFIQDYNTMKSGKAGLSVREQRIKMLESIFTKDSSLSQAGKRIQSDSSYSYSNIEFGSAGLQSSGQSRIDSLRSRKNQSFTGNTLEGNMPSASQGPFDPYSDLSFSGDSLFGKSRKDRLNGKTETRSQNLIKTGTETSTGINATRKDRFDVRRNRFDSLFRRHLDNTEPNPLTQMNDPLRNAVQDSTGNPLDRLPDTSNQAGRLAAGANSLSSTAAITQNYQGNPGKSRSSGFGRLPSSRIMSRRNPGAIQPGSAPIEMHSSGMPKIRLRTYPTTFDLPRRK